MRKLEGKRRGRIGMKRAAYRPSTRTDGRRPPGKRYFFTYARVETVSPSLFTVKDSFFAPTSFNAA
jgi:hypothetical protein